MRRDHEVERRHITILKRIALIAAVFAAMLVLCGCRTRVTNNDEVTTILYDEQGYMAEEYQMRRDELGLARAKKPLFPGIGGPGEDEYEVEYDVEDYDALDEYDPEEEDDFFAEDETDDGSTSTVTKTSSSSSSSMILSPRFSIFLRNSG